MAREEQLGHVPEGGGGNFSQDHAGVTVSVSRKLDPTNLRCFIFDPRGMSTINWGAKGVPG